MLDRWSILLIALTVLSSLLAVTALALSVVSLTKETSEQTPTFRVVEAASNEPMLDTTLSSPMVLDGVDIAEGSSVLLKDEIDAARNGVYLYSQATLIRQPDAETILVKKGQSHANKLFGSDGKEQARLGIRHLTTTDIPEGSNLYHTTARARSAFSAGTGLTYDGTTGLFGLPSPVVLPNQVVVQGGTKDSIVQYASEAAVFTTGIDVSDGGRFKITRSSELDVNPIVTIDPNYVAPSNLTWTNRTVPGVAYVSICWSPELRLACAFASNSTTVATSSDGVTWTTRTAPATGPWMSACWSPDLNLFCAVGASVGAGNQAMTSPDGINWTLRSTPNNCTWQGVCWSPELGVFCAVASSATPSDALIMTSTDGVNWTSSTLPVVASLQSVVWAASLGLFCAVGAGGAIFTSPNGVTWTSQTSPTGRFINSVTWSPELSMFCAVLDLGGGQFENTILTSRDGITWSLSVDAQGWQYRSVVWAKEIGLFCVVGTVKVLTSPNGTDWFMTNYSIHGRSVCWAPELGMLMAVASINPRLATASVFANTPSVVLDSNVMVGTSTANARLQLAGGSVAVNGGLNNTSTRPVLSSTVSTGEIRGHGSTFSSDNGWLRLSAGGGTNPNTTQTTIELTGSSSVSDMDRTIVMRTSGVERFRINNAGAAAFTGALSGGAATVASLNAGSGSIQTTGTLSAAAATVTSLNAGSGAIQTTGTVSGTTVTTNSIQLATSGGTASNLNYYEEATQSITWSGPWASSQNSTIRITRIGSIVCIFFPALTASLSTSAFITSTAILARFRPTSDRYASMQVRNNGIVAGGSAYIQSNGVMIIYGTDTTVVGPFSGAGTQVGFVAAHITYHLNG